MVIQRRATVLGDVDMEKGNFGIEEEGKERRLVFQLVSEQSGSGFPQKQNFKRWSFKDGPLF